MIDGRLGPLTGVRIIEVGHMLAGPYCGMLLADLGADVIKIEPPSGEIARSIGDCEIGGHKTYFASLNRNKRSVVLDLTTPQGQSALHELARTAKGIITNLRPAAIRKFGLTYDQLSRVNPHIACLAITGFGLKGPHSDRPAYDYIIQALTGVMMLTGDPRGPPVRAGYSVADNSSGIMAALGLLAMIFEGKGGQGDVSLYATLLSQLNYIASAYLNTGERPQRYPNGSHPYFVPAQIFETKDSYLALFVTRDKLWEVLATELGRRDWLTDSRFASMRARLKNRDLVIAELQKILRPETTQHWLDRLAPLGLVIAGIETLDRALDARITCDHEMIVEIPTDEGMLRVVGCPIKIEGCATSYRPPPHLGQNSMTELTPTLTVTR